MTPRRLKTAVIGLGVGLSHVQQYQRLPNAELMAICDADPAWLSHCQAAYAVPEAYTDYHELLARSEAEAVSICLPVHLHLPVALDCLAAGRHVLVEKPLAANTAEAQRMAGAARDAQRVLMTSYNQRFGPDMLYLKRVVDEGRLGDIYFARAAWRRPLGQLPQPVSLRATGAYNRNWFNEADKGGGVGRDLGAHMIDAALWIMGFPEIADVTGRAYAHFGPQLAAGAGTRFDVDDHTVGFVRFKNGASLQLEVSFGQHVDQELVVNEFFGTSGGASRGSAGLTLAGEDSGVYTTTRPRLVDTSASTQGHFVESILAGRAPIITPEQGVAVMRIIDGLGNNAAG
jgi:predicted dehydrogenase